MRVCQPGPPALKCSITAGGSRRVTWRFGSTPTGGRPRLVSVPEAGLTTFPPIEISARSQASAGHSGASSGSFQLCVVFFPFAPIRLSHRDNVPGAVPLRPDQHDEPVVEQAEGLVPCFAIVPSIVLDR